jgi:hypothetical protein
MANISGLLGGVGVSLESEAYKQFGAAVEGQVGSKLASIFGKGGPAAQSDAALAGGTSQTRVWDPTPYASAMTNFQSGYDPKTKFLFKVRFKFHPMAAKVASDLGVDVDGLSRDISFVIKQIDLPKVEFEYQDINMYNFKTKVLTGIKHQSLNFILYDDVSNHAMAMIKAYLEILSPIARNRQDGSSRLEDHGFAFNRDINGLDTASRGALPSTDEGGNRKEILSELIVEQFYVNMSIKGSDKLNDIVKLNNFVFVNPRITSFDLSDQDHEASDAGTISLTFEHDALHIELTKSANQSDITQFSGGDMLANEQQGPTQVFRSQGGTGGSSTNPFLTILANQGKRAAQTLISGQLNKALGGIGGGALGGAIYNVSGALGNAAGNTLMNAGQRVSQGMALPSVSLVKDNAGGLPATETVSTRQGK